MFIDSHCHLHFLDLTKMGINLSDVIQNAINNNVTNMLSVATDLSQHQILVKMAEEFSVIKISAGLHPEHVADERWQLKEFTDHLLQLANHPHVVAIGETGLDYYHTNNIHNKQLQHAFFIRQIDVAKQLKKPLIVHTRMAQEDTINILKNEQAYLASGVMHCFTENWDMAKKALDLGFYISFSGIITFNKKVEDVLEVAKKTPLDRILIETDSPYLAPVPFRGKINQPAYVSYVAHKIAELKGLPVKDIANATSCNYKKLFMNS